MVASALAPVGFMPAQANDGFVIKLCSGQADRLMLITRDNPDYQLLALIHRGANNETPAQDHEYKPSDCAYAAGLSASLTADILFITRPLMPSASQLPHALHRIIPRNHLNIPPATGPPMRL